MLKLCCFHSVSSLAQGLLNVTSQVVRVVQIMQVETSSTQRPKPEEMDSLHRIRFMMFQHVWIWFQLSDLTNQAPSCCSSDLDSILISHRFTTSHMFQT